MLLLPKEKLPEGPDWLYEVKLHGYRALAIKTGNKLQLQSRNDNEFNLRYPGIVQALAPLPAEAVIDGEVVALDETGKPTFNNLQNYGSSAAAPVFYFVFDVLVLSGRNVMGEPLVIRRAFGRPYRQLEKVVILPVRSRNPIMRGAYPIRSPRFCVRSEGALG